MSEINELDGRPRLFMLDSRAEDEKNAAASWAEQHGFEQWTIPQWEIGRNDPCPCGSGQKTKKCHALEVFPLAMGDGDDLFRCCACARALILGVRFDKIKFKVFRCPSCGMDNTPLTGGGTSMMMPVGETDLDRWDW